MPKRQSRFRFARKICERQLSFAPDTRSGREAEAALKVRPAPVVREKWRLRMSVAVTPD